MTDSWPPRGTCPCGGQVPERRPFNIGFCDACLDEFEAEKNHLAAVFGDSFDAEAFGRTWAKERYDEWREARSSST